MQAARDAVRLPEALTTRRQWVVWRYERGTKVPYSVVTGYQASVLKPDTWTTYRHAVAAAREGGYDGIGFVLTKEAGIVGIDLDKVIGDDGVVQDWAKAVVTAMNSYTEVSPSGTGLKILVEGTIPKSLKTAQLELYDDKRYFTITGLHWPGTPLSITQVNGELETLYEQHAPVKATVVSPLPVAESSGTDEGFRRYVLAALASEQQGMEAAVEGERHAVRYEAAYKMGGYIPHISETEITEALAVNFGPDAYNAMQTIKDGIAAGKASPRTIHLKPDLYSRFHFTFAFEPDYDRIEAMDEKHLVSIYGAALHEIAEMLDELTELREQVVQLRTRNRFVTQSHAAEGIASPGMRLTFQELQKHIEAEPGYADDPDVLIPVSATAIAKATRQSPSTVSKHLKVMEEHGLIDKTVKRVFDPEKPKDQQWTSTVFVRPRVDLSDPSKVVIESKPRGLRCKKCHSDNLVIETTILCADCGESYSRTVRLSNAEPGQTKLPNPNDMASEFLLEIQATEENLSD